MYPQAPLTCHPWYEDKAWSRSWLEGDDQHALRIPEPSTAAGILGGDASAIPDDLLLTKRRAWGPAPYVGQAFHYEWPVAVDSLGRQIAGDTRIVLHHDDWMRA